MMDIYFVQCVCSSNAIKHLSSLDHAENLRHFCWKYGGGMDLFDKFRISEDDLVKVTTLEN